MLRLLCYFWWWLDLTGCSTRVSKKKHFLGHLSTRNAFYIEIVKTVENYSCCIPVSINANFNDDIENLLIYMFILYVVLALSAKKSFFTFSGHGLKQGTSY